MKIKKKNLYAKQAISRLKGERFADLESIIENALDADFSVVQKRIETTSDFKRALLEPFYDSGERVFYRGERLGDRKRPLIPTIFRSRETLFSESGSVAEVDADFIYRYYAGCGDYLQLYEKVVDANARASMYNLCAFSQHYLDISPFVDFTKSLYVALSFALKGQSQFENDIVLYTVKIKNESDYTEDVAVADAWLEAYHVLVLRQSERVIRELITSKDKKRRLAMMKQDLDRLERMSVPASPSAKLIAIPTNDLMRFQQGVFLLLTDFKLFFNAYPTKNIRDDFEVTKWLIHQDLCPQLASLVAAQAPWYTYDCLLDVKKAFSKAAGQTNTIK